MKIAVDFKDIKIAFEFDSLEKANIINNGDKFRT